MLNYADMHCDTLTAAMHSGQSLFSNRLQLDAQRLLNFGSSIEVFAIWLEKNYLENAFKNTVMAIDFFNCEAKKHDKYIKKVLYSDDIPVNIKSKVLYSIIGIEGGEALENNIENIHHFYNYGVRLITLCWNYKNSLGCGAMSGFTDGLTDFGIECVHEMNRKKMIIDVSHLNEAGFWDVYNNSSMPFAASHSNAFSVCGHKRNLNDSQLKALKECNGIIGINLYPYFLKADGKAKIDDVIKHIDYIMNITGEQAVCLGTDFDGINTTPKGLDDVSSMKVLYECTADKLGIKIADNVFSKNLLNFLRKNLSKSSL